jgi:hypothetical protein
MGELDDWFYGPKSEQELRDQETHDNLNRMIKSQEQANRLYIRNNEDSETRERRMEVARRGRIALVVGAIFIFFILIYLFLTNGFAYKGGW